jgi:uncharacterized protein YejL (UPF0352 family)
MLEELFNLVKSNAQDTVINNPAVPNEQNDAVVASATHTVAEELQNTLAGGGLQNVLALFRGNNNVAASDLASNPVVGNMISNFTNKLTTDHGVAPAQANGIAGNLITDVLGKLINRTNDPNDKGFDLGSIIGSLTGGGSSSSTGGSGFDLGGILNKFSGGLDTDGDGKVELSDIMSKVTGGARQAQTQQGSGGGLMDMIKGFMK